MASLRLETLEQMALVNNPTVAQVQANLRIASGLATQAGLYPNPAVGYYGDEVRGGYSGGGKQGGFVTQTIVLGGKLRGQTSHPDGCESGRDERPDSAPADFG